MHYSVENETPEEHFNSFWREYVTTDAEELDQEAVENELYDYSDLMYRHSSYLSHTTNYRLSKANYSLDDMINVYQEESERNTQNTVIEAVLELADSGEINIGDDISNLLAYLGITAADLDKGYKS